MWASVKDYFVIAKNDGVFLRGRRNKELKNDLLINSV